MKIKNICVNCGSNTGTMPEYLKAAIEREDTWQKTISVLSMSGHVRGLGAGGIISLNNNVRSLANT